MAIKFENIDNGQTVAYSPKLNGKHYRDMISAAVNSSNLNVNADRGQDFGWRLAPEQQVIIEKWEKDPKMIEAVTQFTKTPADALTHSSFLAYLQYEQDLETVGDDSTEIDRAQAEADYKARVDALREAPVEAMRPFEAAKPAKK